MKDPGYIAAHVRRVLMDGGSAPHSEDVQRFFKEEVTSRGWYTAELRKVATRLRRVVLREHGLKYLVQVADQLFRGDVLEEKVFAVMLLEKNVGECTEQDFRLFTKWLDRVTSWADHDALVHNLIGPMIADDGAHARRIYRWAQSPDRWHRRAASVALIRSVRDAQLRRTAMKDIEQISNLLLDDRDDMVRKGLGWLLREAAKADAKATIPLLIRIRDRAPRLVLRTACETLAAGQRIKVLGRA